ncbi:Outer membrane protein TolC [Fodinibius salinus]|uniref:Outer membrane protein TolC n=1 Tax=Fodinibius salinus TaxID=860790 RepID=A0A5D3YIT2_9BACT|nr:TolC family protein [Fodinibius salinus]TYP92150.1 Outer membrane protein TolC [Fodinibius salinus]
MMNFKHSTLYSLVLAAMVMLVLAQPMQAQSRQGASEIREMSLQEALDITKKASFEVRMAEADMEKAKSQYRQTNATFLPQLSVEATGVSTNDPLNVFGFRLKQEAVTQADFNPSRLNDPDAYDNFTTKFQAQQPLFNADAIFQRRAVKKQLEAAKEQLQGTVEHVRYKVKDTYYRLQLMDNKLQVITKSLEMARENERQAQNYHEQGMITKADYLAAKVRMLELQSRQSKVRDQLQTVQDNLRYLLNIDEDLTIVATDSLQMHPAVSNGNINYQNATNSRLDAMEYRMSAAREMLRSSKFNFVPSVNLFGSYEFNDDVLLGTQGESYMVGATLKWNLFSGYENIGKVMESKAQLRKAELAYESQLFKNEMEIKQARRSLDQAQEQLAFAKASVEQSSEDYRIRKNRFEQGMEKTTEMLRAETKLLESKMQRLNALYQYNLSLATLELLLEQEMSY